MCKRKALIALLGANGQLGCSLVHHLSSLCLGNSITLYPVTRSVCDFEKEGSVAKLFALLDGLCRDELYETCLLINAMAYTQVDKAEEEPELATRINAVVVKDLAREVARRDWGMIHFSTDYVFDGKQDTPYQVSDDPNPQSVYGKSKYEGEKAMRNYFTNGKGIVVRTSWLYSPYGKNFLKTVLHLAHTQEELRIVADQYGAPTYAPHLAEYVANLSCRFFQEEVFPSIITHYHDAGVTSWFGFAQEIVQKASLQENCSLNPISTAEYPTLASRPPYSLLALTEDITPLYSWQEGVLKCLKALRYIG